MWTLRKGEKKKTKKQRQLLGSLAGWKLWMPSFTSSRCSQCGRTCCWPRAVGRTLCRVPKLPWRAGRNNVPSCVQKHPTSPHKVHYSTAGYLLAVPSVVQRSCLSLLSLDRPDAILAPAASLLLQQSCQGRPGELSVLPCLRAKHGTCSIHPWARRGPTARRSQKVSGQGGN